MGSLGNCCCIPPNCETFCNAFLPATVWPITALGKSFDLVRHPTYRCYYVAEHCWLGTVTEEASWEHGYDTWDDSVSVPNSCRFDCYDGYGNGLTYDVVQSQTKYKAAVKRFSQERYSIYVSIGPISPTSKFLQMYLEYRVSKTYWHGASQTAHTRYRVSEITCPSTVTTGSWISGAAPTMLSVDSPSFLDGCFVPIYNDFVGGCLLDLGAVVGPTTWGSTSIGTYRVLRENANQEPCVVLTRERFIPNDIAVRKSVYSPIAPSLLWTPCNDAGVSNDAGRLFTCDTRESAFRHYTSASFACDALPASVVCDSGFGTIAPTSIARSCGANSYTDTFPEIPGTITVTL